MRKTRKENLQQECDEMTQGARTRVWGKPKPRQKLHFINGGLQLVARRAEKKSRNLIQCELFISCQKGAGAWIIPPTFDGSKAEGKAGGSTDDTIQWVRKYFLLSGTSPPDFHSPTRTRLYAHNWIVLLHFTSSLNFNSKVVKEILVGSDNGHKLTISKN